MQLNLSLAHHEICNLTTKMDCSTLNYSSVANAGTSKDTFPKDGEHEETQSPLIGDQPVLMESASFLTPLKMEPELHLSCEISASQTPPPINFSTVSPADFGITPEIFTKQSKGGSKSLVDKLKRRSTVGLRGSPENNALIRYIARRRRVKTQKTFTEASPVVRQNTLLKAKIAAFHSSFKTLDETEEKGIHIVDATAKEATTTPHKPSEHGHVSASECEKGALENNQNHKSTSEDRTSAGIQSSTIASPSEKTPVGKGALSKVVPEWSTHSVDSGCVRLECTPSKEVTKTECGTKSLHPNEEPSRDVLFRNSYKKVRFAKKQRVEIFDNTKPPVTPLQSCLSSASLRSALKKTPVRVLPESMEDLHNSGRERGTEHLSNWNSCEVLQTEKSPGTVAEVEQGKKEPHSDISETQPPVAISSCREDKALFSPSTSIEESFLNISPIKQPFSQPNFDEDDKAPEPLEVAVKAEFPTSPDLQDTKNAFDLQATFVRITRSCTKGTRVGGTEKADRSPGSKPAAKKNPKRKSSEFEKAKMAAKSSQRKTPAARRKVFGKRRKRKKEQKAQYGQRETVSKVPPLSPIPEVKEEASMVFSYQSSPASQSSFLDDSVSSLLRGHLANGTAGKRVLCFDEDSDNSLNLPSAAGDATSPTSQLQDSAGNGTKEMTPLDSPESNPPETPKCPLPESDQVSGKDCPANEAEIQAEPELQNPSGTDGNSQAEGALPFTPEADLARASDGVDFKRFPRRSRRLSGCRSNLEVFQSGAPGEAVEGLPPLADDGAFFRNAKSPAEGRPRRVRRSMRWHKEADDEGLVWVQSPANSQRGPAPFGSASRAKGRRSSSRPQGHDVLHPAPMRGQTVLHPVNEEPEKAPVAVGLCGSKRRRKGLCVLGLEENEDVTVHVQRNRRASLGYKSDLCLRKECEASTFLRNQLVV